MPDAQHLLALVTFLLIDGCRLWQDVLADSQRLRLSSCALAGIAFTWSQLHCRDVQEQQRPLLSTIPQSQKDAPALMAK